MKLELRADGVDLTPDLRAYVERRLRFGLTRFGRRVRRVHVLLTDVNGPRGGDDILCKIRVDLAGHRELVVRQVHEDAFGAAARATERAAHGVSRRLEHLQARRRGRSVVRRRHPAARARDAALAWSG